MEITPAGLSAFLNGDMKNFVAATTPGGIEAQEAAGQQDFVVSETLPKEMLHGCTQEKLESVGILFGDDVDDIFVNVVLPNGWQKRPTDHSMWSDLLDANGYVRASIFYKAAFYDRKAHIALTRRFTSSYAPEDDYKSNLSYKERQDGNWYGTVKDNKGFGSRIIFRIGPIKNPTYDQQQKVYAAATSWLRNNYPDHGDALAYWD